jgi:hypothetical protein
MKINVLILWLSGVLFLFGCNPFPKKDNHPEVPELSELLKDQSKFKKVYDTKDLSGIIFLRDGRILLKPNNSNLTFKITDVEKGVVIEDKFDWKLPFYIDEKGDLYFNREKYFYPDYRQKQEFQTVVFQDSINRKLEDLKNLSDSVRFKAVDEYERKLLKPYGLTPCENVVVNTERCDVFGIKNGALIVRQTELFKVDFMQSAKDIPKFDDDVLIAWHNGKLPNPVYLAYYQLQDLKFKCDDMVLPKTIQIAHKNYFYTLQFGLYQIL